jgi:hypothetical protein
LAQEGREARTEDEAVVARMQEGPPTATRRSEVAAGWRRVIQVGGRAPTRGVARPTRRPGGARGAGRLGERAWRRCRLRSRGPARCLDCQGRWLRVMPRKTRGPADPDPVADPLVQLSWVSLKAPNWACARCASRALTPRLAAGDFNRAGGDHDPHNPHLSSRPGAHQRPDARRRTPAVCRRDSGSAPGQVVDPAAVRPPRRAHRDRLIAGGTSPAANASPTYTPLAQSPGAASGARASQPSPRERNRDRRGSQKSSSAAVLSRDPGEHGLAVEGGSHGDWKRSPPRSGGYKISGG